MCGLFEEYIVQAKDSEGNTFCICSIYTHLGVRTTATKIISIISMI